jgi:hypothetical protein
MKKTITTLRAIAMASIAACTVGLGSHALAANHALIMTIDYANTPNALPGIDKDAEIATKIAEGMGVPRQNIKRVRNQELTLAGMSSLLNELVQNRISDGDKVFLYYSGHGYQRSGSGVKCTESLVSADEKFFEDERLQQALDKLAAKASQVVMFNDSCFSGGAATKDLSRSGDDSVPKAYQDLKAGSSADADYACGSPTNKDFFGSRSLGVVARQRPTQMLYVAASGDNEVSRATSNGSWGTLAWAHCLASKAADQDGNGLVDGEELRQCSQGYIDKNFSKRQTIKLIGNDKLMMSFAGNSTTTTAPITNARGTLETLRASADPGMQVGMSITKSRLTIGKDLLDFSVTTGRPGYLHLLHVSSDGKFYVLFPNKLDSNNFVQAGTHRFPRAAWGIQAQGPQGTSYVMAYLSDSPKDFTKELDSDGPFATGDATGGTSRKLGIVALNGRYGASQVSAIQEVK